jgi:hypothetical protein
MPDTSSAAYRRHADRPVAAPRSLLVSGLEPVDGTWFEAGDESPSDAPLIVLVPVRRTH